MTIREQRINALRMLEKDHGPDGYPAVKMRDISALLDMLEADAVPVVYMQVYRCSIKSRAKIRAEIPREKQGWWADVCPGETLRLRQAVQADIDRCTLNSAHSRNPDDYMCETFKSGALVSKCAIEFMNPEQNVFASVAAPQPAIQERKPLTDQWIRERCNQTWVFDTVKAWVREVEAAHGITKGGAG